MAAAACRWNCRACRCSIAARNFAGYRGFGVCRDLDGLARLAALRRYELFSDPPAPQALSADRRHRPGRAGRRPASDDSSRSRSPIALRIPTPELLALPIRIDRDFTPNRSGNARGNAQELSCRSRAPRTSATTATKSPALTPVENNAFNELARQLSARLESESGALAARRIRTDSRREAASAISRAAEAPRARRADRQWLVAARAAAARRSRSATRTLLDLLPVGVLIYRLDRLLYANAAFLERMGYASLHALEEAGGLDALYVEPGVSSASSTSDTGTPVTISATPASASTRRPSADRRAALHDLLGRRIRAGADLLGRRAASAGDRRRDRRAVAVAGARRRAGALAGRPRQCRGTRRHPRYHGRRHRDVRCRGQHQFLQPQRRSAVRL